MKWRNTSVYRVDTDLPVDAFSSILSRLDTIVD